MDKVNTYTSTGIKLMHHPDVIAKLKNRYAPPVSLQIAPTSRCNLNCVFCSNVNRGRNEDLDEDALKALIVSLRQLGMKTIEWTGGGEPTLYHSINEIMEWANISNIKQGLITNGVELAKRISKGNLNILKWIRISMNCLDYMDDIEIPEINGTLGFSYVMNEKSDTKAMLRLFDAVEKHNPAYVRIVPNCQATDEEQKRNNRELSQLVKLWGSPYFYQAKVFQKPKECYWCYLKPFLLHDGWVYPCSSVVLNYDAERWFHEKYRWVKMEDLPLFYVEKMKPCPTESCNHCVFFNQNELIRSIVEPMGMEDFI